MFLLVFNYSGLFLGMFSVLFYIFTGMDSSFVLGRFLVVFAANYLLEPLFKPRVFFMPTFLLVLFFEVYTSFSGSQGNATIISLFVTGVCLTILMYFISKKTNLLLASRKFKRSLAYITARLIFSGPFENTESMETLKEEIANRLASMQTEKKKPYVNDYLFTEVLPHFGNLYFLLEKPSKELLFSEHFLEALCLNLKNDGGGPLDQSIKA